MSGAWAQAGSPPSPCGHCPGRGPAGRAAAANRGVCWQENAELFRAVTTSQSWKDYVIYIDGMVLNAFDNFIRMSLSYLINNMVLDVSRACEARDHVCLCLCVRPCACCDPPTHCTVATSTSRRAGPAGALPMALCASSSM